MMHRALLRGQALLPRSGPMPRSRGCVSARPRAASTRGGPAGTDTCSVDGTPTTTTMSSALQGVQVLSLEQAVAAPLCTARLAEHGARVIKVERPGVGDFGRGYDGYLAGGELSSYFGWLNRGKQSLEANVKDDEEGGDLALLHRILKESDVFVQNLAPGAADRLGLSSASLRAQYPSLITVDISGYGQAGPKRDYKAYDLLVQAESAICSVTGTPEGGEGRVGCSVCDLATGLNAFGSIMAALYHRERTGQGSGIQLSLFDTAAELMTQSYVMERSTGREPGLAGLSHPSIAPYGAFTTADGKRILISIQNEREWESLCRNVLLRPDLLDDERFQGNTQRIAHRDVVDGTVADSFSRFGRDDLSQRLLDAGIAFGALNSVRDLAEHAQLTTATGTYTKDDGSTASFEVPRSAAAYMHGGSRTPAQTTAAQQVVPRLGSHNTQLRAEFAAAE